MFKDTPQGQTHYYGDGCGEPMHNMTHAEQVYQAILELVKQNDRAFSKKQVMGQLDLTPGQVARQFKLLLDKNKIKKGAKYGTYTL